MNKRLSILFIFLSLNLWAQNICDRSLDIDLREGLPPLRDQDDVGFCHAYAGTDLVNFEIIKKNGYKAPFPTNKLVSPFAMALQSYIDQNVKVFKDNKDIMAGGLAIDIINNFLKSGGCSEQSISSRMSLGNDLLDALKSIQQASANSSLDCVDCSLPVEMLNQMPKLKGQEEAIKTLVRTQSEPNLILNKMMEAACEKIKPEMIGNIKLQSHELKGDDLNEIISHLDDALTIGKPARIGVDPHVFIENVNGEHHSVIIAGKIKSPTCKDEYILRNSWGRGCEQYTASRLDIQRQMENCHSLYITEDEYQREQAIAKKFNGKNGIKITTRNDVATSAFVVKTNKEKATLIYKCQEDVRTQKYQADGIRCEKGYLFVSADRLKKFMYSVTYLKN